MDNSERFIGGVIGTLLTGVGASLSINEIQSIVSIICTILGFLITLILTCIIPLIKKIKKAAEDGHIDVDEAEDIAKDTLNMIDKIQNKINKGDKDGK